jgi:hypothetical protein
MRKERSDLAETVSHNQTGKLLKPEHKKNAPAGAGAPKTLDGDVA